MDPRLLGVAIQEQGIMMDHVTTHVYSLNLFSLDQKNCRFLLSGPDGSRVSNPLDMIALKALDVFHVHVQFLFH